jgi:hypothetical protein
MGHPGFAVAKTITRFDEAKYSLAPEARKSPSLKAKKSE